MSVQLPSLKLFLINHKRQILIWLDSGVITSKLEQAGRYLEDRDKSIFYPVRAPFYQAELAKPGPASR